MKNKNLLIGAGVLLLVYALGEVKHKKAKKECKKLVPTKFGINYGFWSRNFLDLTPKLFRKVVTMKEWRSSYEKELIFRLATINDERLVTENGIFTQKGGKFFRQPSSDYFLNKNIVEITKADFQKEIDSINAQAIKREDDLNNCKGSTKVSLSLETIKPSLTKVEIIPNEFTIKSNGYNTRYFKGSGGVFTYWKNPYKTDGSIGGVQPYNIEVDEFIKAYDEFLKQPK